MLALLSIALAVLSSLFAQQAAPHGSSVVPIRAEHHHHLALENSYVRAYKVEVPPHAATLMHEHDFDYLYVVLGDADIINAVQGKPEARVQFKDADIHFSRGRFAHIARNVSDRPFRNVTIELLRPQGAERSLCAGPNDAHPENCRLLLDALTRPLPNGRVRVPQFETDEVRVELIALDLGSKMRWGVGETDRLAVALEGAEVSAGTSGKPPVTLRSGDLLWFAGAAPHTLTNVGSRPARVMILEFKDSGNENPSARR